MIRVAFAGLSTREVLASPNRGRLFEIAAVIGSDDDARTFGVPIVESPSQVEADYLFVSDRRITGAPHRTFVLDTGDVLGAIFDGAQETRSTLTLAEGALFLVSAPFPVPPIVDDARARGDAELIESYAALHRRWMIETSFGLMLQKAIEFLAAGEVHVVKDVVWIDGVPGPCRLGDAPAVCRDQERAGVPVSCPFIAT